MQFRRRSYPRHTLRSLAYVRLAEGNGGIIRDLTESGVAIQAVAPLHPGQEITLRFDLISPRVHVETHGRVAWANASGQGGIQFIALPRRTLVALKDWLLIQILSAAAISGRDTIFETAPAQLTLSASARPAILVDSLDVCEASHSIHWGGLALSPRTFSIFVDTLVLLCAVLLFSVSSLAVMGGFPAWPLSTALLVTSTAIFVAVYQLLFSQSLYGATPGRRLARLAARTPSEEPLQRFR